MMTEETKEKLRAAGRHDLIEADEINDSGFAGISRDKGMIVDRRKFPDAFPVPKNTMLGIPEARTVHELKCEGKAFEAKWVGIKPWEYRLNDRNFRVGDAIIEKEYWKAMDTFSGRQIVEEITYICEWPFFGIPKGYCVMSTREFSRKEN